MNLCKKKGSIIEGNQISFFLKILYIIQIILRLEEKDQVKDQDHIELNMGN